MTGLSQFTLLPEIIEHLGPSEEESSREGYLSRLERAKLDAGWVDQQSARGFPLLHAHSVVGIWSALEVLCEDFPVAWLQNRSDAWKIPELSKLKVPLTSYHEVPENQRGRFVISELSRSLGADLKKGTGKLKALLAPFNLMPPVGEQVHRALHELCQVRNAIVHTGGLADQKLLDECPWLEMRADEEIAISHAVYGWYLSAARCFAERILNQTMVQLGFEGCKCPGAEEIRPRP